MMMHTMAAKYSFHRVTPFLCRSFVTAAPTLQDVPPSIEHFQPGLCVIRNALTIHQQIRLTKTSCTLGTRAAPLGFFDDHGQPNSRAYRGRIFSAVSHWPHWIQEQICHRTVRLAREQDKTLPPMSCTHILLLCYMNAEGVGWHRDIYENDGQKDHPVITVNLGNSCEFIFKDDHTAPKTHVTLNSGDCLIFGGPQRHAMHKVAQVFEHTCPSYLADDIAVVLQRAKETSDDGALIGTSGRLSLTFRDAPSVIGREEEFSTFKVDEHFDKEENFNWNAQDNGLIDAQPGQEK